MIAALNHAGDSDSSGCPVTEKDSKMFRNSRMRWELRRGRALDVWSSGEYPSSSVDSINFTIFAALVNDRELPFK